MQTDKKIGLTFGFQVDRGQIFLQDSQNSAVAGVGQSLTVLVSDHEDAPKV